jgi:hypothetical protein
MKRQEQLKQILSWHSGKYDEYYLLECYAVKPGTMLRALGSAFLCGLLLDPEDGVSTFHRNVGKFRPDYTR